MSLYNNVSLLCIRLLTILVPRNLHPPFALFWGGLFYLLLPSRRRSIRENIRVVTGRDSVGLLVFATFYKFARNMCDVMLMMRLHGPKLAALMGRRSSSRVLDEALAAGCGAILISPHLGNWELGGLGLADMGYPLNVLTYREPDEKVNALREQVRRERGIRSIYVDRTDTSPHAAIEAANALWRNEVIALLGERDGSSQTVVLNFFSRPTPIPVGAAWLALASGAPVIPVFVPLEGNRYATLMDEPIYIRAGRGDRALAIREGTERILRVFERYIGTYPDQWYNFFDYWGTGAANRERALKSSRMGTGEEQHT